MIPKNEHGSFEYRFDNHKSVYEPELSALCKILERDARTLLKSLSVQISELKETQGLNEYDTTPEYEKLQQRYRTVERTLKTISDLEDGKWFYIMEMSD